MGTGTKSRPEKRTAEGNGQSLRCVAVPRPGVRVSAAVGRRWLFAFVLAAGTTTRSSELGRIAVGGQVYRDVVATMSLHPFLTDADMLMYSTDTRGRVRTLGGLVTFCYPGIRQVLLNDSPLRAVGTGPNLVRVRMPAGTHDVAIVASAADATLALPETRADSGGLAATREQFADRATALGPGAEVVVGNGVHTDWGVLAIAGGGTEDRPVVVRPETPGGVIFRGHTQIRIQGRHIVFKGFRFHNASPTHLVHLTDGEHIRISQCQFAHCGSPVSTFGHIIRIGRSCHSSRIDHCYFTGNQSMSIGLRVYDHDTAGLDNRLDHNVFRDIYRYAGNGQENIQLGGGDAAIAPRCIVEYCLFDHAWGDSEIISNKSSGNIIRYNVAAHCVASAFTLRAGDGVRFEGNVMFNNGAGLRVYGTHHVLANNLFVDPRGCGIALEGGSADRRQRVAAGEVLVAHNTLINCGGAAISGDRESTSNPFPAKGGRVVNNLVVGPGGTLLDLASDVGFDVTRNILWGTSSAVAEGIGRDTIRQDPRLSGAGARIRPGPGSPAIDAAVPVAEVGLDRWQRPRPYGAAPDIGSDEVGPAARGADFLPQVPARPLVSPDLYKGELVLTLDSTMRDGGLRLTDGPGVDAGGVMPAEFVMEWEYSPDTFAAVGTVAFPDGAKRKSYTVSWGGVDENGVPLGLITLRDGTTQDVLAEGPDIMGHRMSYRRGRTFAPPTATRPSQPYAFTLIKRRGWVWLALRPGRRYGDTPVIPVLVWAEHGTGAGRAQDGGSLQVLQTGAGVWRNAMVWRCEYTGPTPPAAPAAVVARGEGPGRVALHWNHGRPGRTEAVYEVYRSELPTFVPSADNRVAHRVRGRGYDDFDVAPGRVYHYRVRARNTLGLVSDFVTVEAEAAATGPFHLCLEATAAESVKAPFVLQEEHDSGDVFLLAPLHSGLHLEAPPNDGPVVFSFRVPKTGEYAIWLSTKADNGSQDSFYTALDSEGLETYRGFSAVLGDTWTWRRAWLAPLDEGEHRLRIKHREPGAGLKAVLITDDVACVPR